jgi:hypothetical protein
VRSPHPTEFAERLHAPGARGRGSFTSTAMRLPLTIDGALGHRQIVGEEADLVLLGGIEPNDGAAAEGPVDRHRGLALDHADMKDMFSGRCQGLLAGFCDAA